VYIAYYLLQLTGLILFLVHLHHRFFLITKKHILFSRLKYWHRNWQWRWPSTPGTWCFLCDSKAEASQSKNAEAEILQAKPWASVAAIGVTKG
jgi:hypothetical protein